MDWTDRHCRYFHRQFSRRTLLYTEMVTAPALVRGGARHLLAFDPEEHPVACQLGGSDPAELAEAAAIVAEAGYQEVNLNVGCPSDRVQSGAFGAVLMERPEIVAALVQAMSAAQSLPVTVKCRIGVDDQDPRDVLPDFIQRIADAGVTRVAIHARKAWLKGLSPKENRDIPPLDYPLVLEMKERFPDLHVSVNGGIASLDEAQGFLDQGLDGVMVGRAAYHDPAALLGPADQRIFGATTAQKSRLEIVDAMRPYIAQHLEGGGRLHAVTRHMLSLFSGQPGARAWRRILSEEGGRPGAGLDCLDRALETMHVRAA